MSIAIVTSDTILYERNLEIAMKPVYGVSHRNDTVCSVMHNSSDTILSASVS